MTMLCADTFEFDRDRWATSPRKSKRSVDVEFSRDWTKRIASRRPPLALKPTIAYAKRSAHLGKLRNETQSLGASSLDEVVEPTHVALNAAESFINGLLDGCLDFSLELSHDGEINFLYGNERDLFHIHIDDGGALSYYSRLQGIEDFGDELSPSSFPHNRLLSFTGHAK